MLRLSSVIVTGDGYWRKKETLAMFSAVMAEIFHVTPAAKINDSPGRSFGSQGMDGFIDLKHQIL